MNKYDKAINELSNKLSVNKDKLVSIKLCSTYSEASKLNPLFTELVQEIDTKYKGFNEKYYR